MQRATALWSFLAQGASRQGRASVWALLLAWTGVPFMLWLAAFGFVAGAIAGLFGSQQLALVNELHVNEPAGVVGAVVGGAAGALSGFLVFIVAYIHDPVLLIGSVAGGFVVSAIALLIWFYVEPDTLRWRQYRSLSRRERELLDPLCADACRRLGMSFTFRPWIKDLDKPAAWTSMRFYAISSGLLGDYPETERQPQSDFDPLALSAILAHELHHWRVRDAVGLAWVWCCLLPVVVFFNAGTWLRQKSGFLGTLGWILFWPAWVTIKLIVVPAMSDECQRQEYEADARVASLGDDYRLGLRRALTELRPWDQPRSGWEEAIASTHPPIEHRLDRLEAPPEPVPEAVPVPTAPRPIPPPAPVADPPASDSPSAPVRAPDPDLDPRAPQRVPAPQPQQAPAPEPPPATGRRKLARTRDAPGGPHVPDVSATAETAQSEQPPPPAASEESTPTPPAPKAPPKPRPKQPEEPSDAAAQWGVEPDESDTPPSQQR